MNGQGFGHINYKGEIIPVLIRQGKHTWSYKIRKANKNEVFNSKCTVMDNEFFNTDKGLSYIQKLKNGESVTL